MAQASSSKIPQESTPLDEYPPLPSGAALSHQHPALRSDHGPFLPSDLLCSLLPSSLPSLAHQLSEYGAELSTELQSVVDAEYKDFIALAARLGGERQRIDRLANWAAGAGGKEGLDGVRIQVEEERDSISIARTQVSDLLTSRQLAEDRKAHLQLLLAFSDALQRLEALLLLQPEANSSPARSPRIDRHVKLELPRNDVEKSVAVSSDWDDDELETLLSQSQSDGSEDDASSSFLASDEDDDETAQSSRQKPPAANGVAASRLKSDHTSTYQQTRILDLPTRIARCKTSWEALSFIRTSALQIDEAAPGLPDQTDPLATSSPLRSFLDAHDARLKGIEVRLKEDLKDLLGRLLIPGSLLVDATPQEKLANYTHGLSDLDGWSQVPPTATDDDELARLRYIERRQWLLLIFDAWIRVGSRDSSPVEEMREFVRQQTVGRWSKHFIHSERLSPTSANTTVPASDSSPGLQRQQQQRLLLVDESSAFTSMFNSILRYGWSLRHLMTTMEQFQPQREVHGLSSVASDTQSIEKGIPLADHANLDPFQAIFWQEISRAIVDQVGSQLFFVGRLDEFHQNYIATQSFLASLEALAPSKRTGSAWREHPSYIHFMKRWQLSAYFQIRYRIVATGLEAQLGPAHLPGSFAQAKLPLLAPTQAVLEAFASPWQDGVHLPPLISKQWRLSMMAVSRYSAWLEEQVPANVKFITAQHPSSTADATLPRSSMDGHSGLAAQIVATRGTSGTPARTSTPDAEAHAQDEETLKLLATVTADALWLEGELVTAFEREIEPKMQMPLSNAIDKSSMDGINDLRIEMREALLDTLPFRTEMLPGITHRLVSILKARCAEPLRLVRSVNTQYRSGASTPSAAPTTTTTSQVEPSYFIPQILRSLRIFFGKAERNEDASSSPMTPARLVPSADIKTAWATEVIDDVATKYAASLTQMIQNHESLKRLKRGNTAGMRGGLTGLASSLLRGGGGGGPGAAGASSASSSLSPASSSADKEDPEWEKMQAQMKADVAKLEDEVADLQAVGVNVKLDDSEAWRRLKEVVQVKSGRNL